MGLELVGQPVDEAQRLELGRIGERYDIEWDLTQRRYHEDTPLLEKLVDELELKKALITLGRPGVQVAVITRRPQGYFITHVEGSHPVVNGESIGGQARKLEDHDVVELAGVKMEFFTVS